jgi:carboxyl-terminal processing protease
MLAVSGALVAFVLLGGVLGRSLAVEGTYSFLKLFNEVLYLVRNNYVEPVKDDALMEGAYRGMLEALDPQSEYLSAEEVRLAATGARSGAADVGLVLSKRRGYAVVVSSMEDSPARKAGLGTGDVILTIEGKSTLGMGVWEATRTLQGKPGSTARMTVLRGSEARSEEMSLVRKTPVHAAVVATIPEAGTGILKVSALMEGDALKVRKSLASLKSQGAKRLILDLRSNAGSRMDEAVKVAGLFAGAGVVAQVADRKAGKSELTAPADPAVWSGPLVAVVDGGTAGAAEVLAAALRDRAGASLVGEKTWGLGTLQRVITLPAGDGIRLSVAKYLSPTGKDWNGTGLSPDVAQAKDSGSGSEDLQLKKALEVLWQDGSQRQAA